MAESQPGEVSSTSDFAGGTSESTLQINIKTLDSQIYSFNVDKNIPVAAFKEKIASQSGVPVGQQRLIFRGKVLKDDHLLSDYNVETGDTLHLVERQPHSSSGSGTGEAASSNSSRVHESNAGGARNRIGPIAHSIVLGTLNVGDPGEAVVPDLSRVIGAVLNTISINNQTGVMHPGVPSFNVNQADGSRINAGSQSQDGNQSVPLQASSGQSAPHTAQIPLGAAISPPSLSTPIPDSLNTITEFINRMELAFSQNVNQPNQTTTASNNLPTVELPSNELGLPTVEALSIILQHAQRLLSDHAVPAISRTAGRLNQEVGSNDPAVREQVQRESVQLGMAVQHLGALFLELGRTILTLRVGQSPAESFVNAGPAVYISPSGPNPIMVQPFPLQTSSLFSGSSGVSPTPIAVGTAGVSSIPRNVNIHIHTGAALAPIVSTIGPRAPNAEGMRGERVNGTESGDSGQARGAPGINVTATAVPSQRAMITISGSAPPSTGVSQAPDSNSISSMVAETNARIRMLVANMQTANNSPAGQAEVSTNQEQHVDHGAADVPGQNTRARDTNDTLPLVAAIDNQEERNAAHQHDIKNTVDVVNSSDEPSTSSERVSLSSSASNLGNATEAAPSGAPLGLGMGGLRPKKRGQLRSPTKGGDGAGARCQNQQSTEIGQRVLQSLASLSTKGSADPLSLGQSENLARGAGQSIPTAMPNTDSQTDVADAMSQILDNPALDGLLSGVSQQTGIGSPDMLRDMLQQFTQNPAMRNTVNQIAQQVDSHDLGSMFSGLDRGPGGGIDLARMMQQMMPIVSQALGGISPTSQLAPPSAQMRPGETMTVNDRTQHVDLDRVVQMLETRSSAEETFYSLVESALDLAGNGISRENIVNAFRGQGHLAQEFMEMLRDDVSQRFHDRMGS